MCEGRVSGGLWPGGDAQCSGCDDGGGEIGTSEFWVVVKLSAWSVHHRPPSLPTRDDVMGSRLEAVDERIRAFGTERQDGRNWVSN